MNQILQKLTGTGKALALTANDPKNSLKNRTTILNRIISFALTCLIFSF